MCRAFSVFLQVFREDVAWARPPGRGREAAHAFADEISGNADRPSSPAPGQTGDSFPSQKWIRREAAR